MRIQIPNLLVRSQTPLWIPPPMEPSGCTSPSPQDPAAPEAACVAAGGAVARRPCRRSVGKGTALTASKCRIANRDDSSSSSSPSVVSNSSCPQAWRKGVRLRRRARRAISVTSDSCTDDRLQDLALPLGMSFAAVVSQVLNGKNVSKGRISIDHLSYICTAAVKESVTNIYGERFDSFMKSFSKSFGSTLKTLHKINEVSTNELENTACNSSTFNECGNAPTSSTMGPIEINEDIQECTTRNPISNQLIIHGHINQQLAHVSHSTSNSLVSHSLLNTFERSVLEQARSNDLKTLEIGLVVKKLQLKQSQLALSSYTNMLEKIKITMGFSKASFKEEKLRNQIQETRHAELLKRFIDLLVTGLIIMCAMLVYGAYVFSYQRIMEATSACTSPPKENKSWWVPKSVASFGSGWNALRCHVTTLSRMSFGILMILTIAYLVFQRSASSGPAMPVTFMIMLLGVICGFAGKLCVDTLGANGYQWLICWEALCIIHFFATVFPDFFYHVLYGPVAVSQGTKAVRSQYMIRRYSFYTILLLVLPTITGLLPFASFYDWKEHFSEKLFGWRSGNEDGI